MNRRPSSPLQGGFHEQDLAPENLLVVLCHVKQLQDKSKPTFVS